MRTLFDDPTVEEIDPEGLMGDYPAVEYVPPDGRYSIDLLTRLGEAFAWTDVHGDSEELAVGSLRVRVASPRLLRRMKKDTLRLQDRADAARIQAAFGLEDG